jgi:uncharacterized protein involved in exopolysaccharide biosynthesis
MAIAGRSTAEPETPREVLEDVVQALRARKLPALLAFAAAVVAAYVYLQFQTDQYEAEAGLFVRLGRENAETPVTVAKGIVNTIGVREEEVNSDIQLLSSQSLTEEVLDRVGVAAFEFEAPPPRTLFQKLKAQLRAVYRWARAQVKTGLIALGLKKPLSKREEAIELLLRSLTVDRVKSSDVIRLRLRLPDPALASRCLDELLASYFRRHSEVRKDANVADFFTARTEDHERRLEDIDRRIIRLRDGVGLSAVDRQRSLLLGRLDDAQKAIEEAEDLRELVEKRRASAGRTSGPEPIPSGSARAAGDLVPNPSVEAIREKLTAMHLERVSASGSRTESSQSRQRLEAQIDEVESLLLHGLNERLAQLRARAHDLEARLKALNAGQVALDQLNREKGVDEQNYYVYAKRMEEARINDELNRSRVVNVSVLYPPTVSIEPVAPRKLLIMGIALAVGVALGFSAALVPAYFDNTLRTGRDVRGVAGVTFLGTFRLPGRGRGRAA